MAKPLNDINGIFSFEKSFKEWLEEIFESRASSDYPSRLRKFFTQYSKDEHQLFQGQPIYRCLDRLPIELIQQWIDYCLIQAENISNPKEKSNIKSAINKFRVFIQEHFFSSNTKITSTYFVLSEEQTFDLSRLKGFFRSEKQLRFSQDELCKIFLSQFKSEDRRLTSSEGLIYPIKAITSFINRETEDRNLMTRFFNAQSHKIRILLKDSECRVGDIDSLILESPDVDNFRQVLVVLNNKIEKVYTQDRRGLIPLRVKTSSDIHRDHDKAIANILKDLDNCAYPCLCIVSEACREAKSKSSTDIQKSLYNLLSNRNMSKCNFAYALYSEIEKFFSENLSFTLMEGKANRQKSDSI